MSSITQSRRTFVVTSLMAGIAVAARVNANTDNIRSQKVNTIIQQNTDIATLINVFDVEAEKQHDLVQLLREGTETLISKMGGWISTNILDSKDGRRVVIYSQWKTVKDIDAMQQNPQMGPYVQRIKALSTMEAIRCDVAYVHHA